MHFVVEWIALMSIIRNNYSPNIRPARTRVELGRQPANSNINPKTAVIPVEYGVW